MARKSYIFFHSSWIYCNVCIPHKMAANMSILFFYHLEYLDYCLHLYCYIPNVWTDASFDHLLVFHDEFGSRDGNSNWSLQIIPGSRLFPCSTRNIWRRPGELHRLCVNSMLQWTLVCLYSINYSDDSFFLSIRQTKS